MVAQSNDMRLTSPPDVNPQNKARGPRKYPKGKRGAVDASRGLEARLEPCGVTMLADHSENDDPGPQAGVRTVSPGRGLEEVRSCGQAHPGRDVDKLQTVQVANGQDHLDEGAARRVLEGERVPERFELDVRRLLRQRVLHDRVRPLGKFLEERRASFLRDDRQTFRHRRAQAPRVIEMVMRHDGVRERLVWAQLARFREATEQRLGLRGLPAVVQELREDHAPPSYVTPP